MALEGEQHREELQEQLERYRRLIDLALDKMTLESIRELVREIEDKLRETEWGRRS
jgi:hypothetical protein